MAARRKRKGEAEPIFTGRFVIEVGPLQFGSALRQIRDFLWNCGLQYEIEEDGGWLGGTIRIEVEGPEPEVDAVIESLEDWVAANTHL